MTKKHMFRGGLIILAGMALCLVSLKAAPNKVVTDYSNQLRR